VEPWTNGPENTGLTALTQMVEVLGSDPRCCKFESCERYWINRGCVWRGAKRMSGLAVVG
jgi:hypothetical protein